MFVPLLTLVAAVAAALGHANRFFQEPLLILLFPLALAWLGTSAKTPWQAWRRGFWAATLGYGACLYWIVVPINHFGHVPLILAAPCPVLLAMYLAIYPGMFCMLLRRAGAALPGPLLGVLAGCLWAAVELAHEQLFTGFPWLPMASALVARPWAAQAAALVGGTGLAAVLVMATVWLATPLLRRSQRPAPATQFAGLALLALWVVHGHHALEAALPDGQAVSVGIVQGNVDQSLKWDKAFRDETIRRYMSLSEGLYQGTDPQLLVWPETAMPFYLQDFGDASREVRDFVGRSGRLLLTGAPAYSVSEDRRTINSYNRAYLLGPGGGDLGHYDKEHLVPFGEYVPFGKYLPLQKMVEGIGDFLPGQDQPPLRAGPLSLGVLICYESIFPDLAQAQVSGGANLLVNISNDAWFLQTSAPLQHMRQAALRAVEQGRWLVRSTNTGISAFIDPRGRVLQSTPSFVETAAMATVQTLDATTVYHRYYTFIRVSLLLVGALLLVAGLLGPRPER